MVAVDGIFEPIPVQDGDPKARAEIESLHLKYRGGVRFIFDCGIENEEGSWPFAIDLGVLSNDFIDGWRVDREWAPCAAASIESYCCALEAEAARVRSMIGTDN